MYYAVSGLLQDTTSNYQSSKKQNTTPWKHDVSKATAFFIMLTHSLLDKIDTYILNES